MQAHAQPSYVGCTLKRRVTQSGVQLFTCVVVQILVGIQDLMENPNLSDPAQVQHLATAWIAT
jgi:hypothetical protein